MYACEKPTKKHPEGRRGTEAGYRRHLYRKETPCDECMEGARRKARQRHYEASPWMHPVEVDLLCERPTKKFPEGRRGTNAGHQAHKVAGEAPCDECLQARKEYNAARMRKTYDRYKEKKLEYQKVYREENKEALREAGRRKYENNRGYYEVRQRARERRIRDLTISPFTDEAITQAHGTICYLCETPVDLNLGPGWSTSPQRDHVHPISHPDTPGHVIENVKWTHARCNMSKGAKLLEELELPFPPPARERYRANEESEVFV